MTKLDLGDEALANVMTAIRGDLERYARAASSTDAEQETTARMDRVHGLAVARVALDVIPDDKLQAAADPYDVIEADASDDAVDVEDHLE